MTAAAASIPEGIALDKDARQQRRARIWATTLTLPLVAFIGVTFLAPLGSMLTRSVHDPLVADTVPATIEALRDWDGSTAPSPDAFAALAQELKAARQERTIGQLATRVNRVTGGMRSVITRTGRKLARVEPPAAAAGEQAPDQSDFWKNALLEAEDAWAEPTSWLAVQRAGERYTGRHYLHALDLDRDPAGDIVRREPTQRIYVALLVRTLLVSVGITGLCLLLGYPLAYFIAHAPPNRANLLLLLVLVPFWTSLLVRTTSWIVLLQSQGVLNDIMVATFYGGKDA